MDKKEKGQRTEKFPALYSLYLKVFFTWLRVTALQAAFVVYRSVFDTLFHYPLPDSV